ncbi:bifunctional adenosylcobinamide kinase/adenosylcobinamide-phosphate guanylyltransferase [Chitinophaga sp. Cy-1792]|uniref:bifunctional adenosylcobinamide kinase/adenosylcobinamide-phosphate guanylyltransferase n=1 Tax=Chitinophaga sp. Cy-1792 TaxID=2608339 RepID=UPI00141E0019|nr:bifunctional adenosylcobinamide kinase/adenosylcobinamide-phosphate guanylyltransferase [Chitinophaga sp. Cy-1792]NIG52070.1 bifunctional adenosylcobinamide kinase/adenosylcobinamide-phosphate guanylyltransferase [Chitinophaga sp. Cy-1792]
MIYLITGGVRSGKSRYAQTLALSHSPSPVYVATARIWDEDFAERVQRHKDDRSAAWINYEEERYISRLPLEGQTVLIDCVTLWLTNLFEDSSHRLEPALETIKAEIDAIHQKAGTYIIVTNEIGMGIHGQTVTARKFADLQGWTNQYIARLADTVILMIAGIPVIIKDEAGKR